MSTFLKQVFAIAALVMVPMAVCADEYQLTNADFEDWSGAAFDGQPQPAGWNASNVTQFGFKFNFAHREAGHTGSYSMRVQDQSVGAAGITEVSPGYFSLGQPWVYIPSLTQVGAATAGTVGGIRWQHRPDTMSVWIKRTGANVDKEDFYLLYYAWERDASSNSYKGKNGNCTSYQRTNEESDIRIALNANDCGTQVDGQQVSEGMWRERREYGEWTNIRVPIYYLNGNTTKWMNIIFSASNYPNARSNSGLYDGNSLFVDDVELIYASNIQTLLVDGMVWNGFDPNSTGVQYYALGEDATVVPDITAKRGAGTLTNASGKSKTFPGRFLTESEMTIVKGDLSNTPTVITVTSEDGRSTTVYKIQFQKAASSNAKLAGIRYTVNGTDTLPLPDFNPNTSTYTLSLPYGTTQVPTIACTPQEDKQTVQITQASSLSDAATILVTAPNGKATKTYTVSFTIAQLADNNLAGIEVNGTSLPGFNPTQTNYKVSLPVGTSTLSVVPVKKYPGQMVTVSPATMPTGTAIDGTVVELAVTTPGNPTPRKYRLTIRLEASSYSYLGGLTITGDQINQVNPHVAGDSLTIDFAPDNMIYYVTLNKGATELPVITATKGDEYQTDPQITYGGLDGTTRVTATAANGDQSVYKIVFSTLKSNISTLNDIKIGGVSIEGFEAANTSYTVPLPVGTTQLPAIEAVPGDEYQNIVVTEAGLNGKTRITVTAGDGSTTIYQIAFSVEAFTDNTLQSLAVAGFSLQNAAGENVDFDPAVAEYWVNLPQGTTARPEVSYELVNTTMQSASARGANDLPCDYRVTVRPQSGASLTYVIHFTVTTSNNTNLTMLYLDGTPISDFRSDSLHYIDSLPEGVTKIPAVSFDKAEKEQRVVSVLDGKRQTITVTAQDGKTKQDYVIDFIVRASENAYLNMIYLNGTALPGYTPKTLEYTYSLKEPVCPAVTVDKAPGQQVTITAPYALGDAVIKVQPEAGAANSYIIHFVAPANESVQLRSIRINGTEIENYKEDSLNYTATYAGQHPEVTYLAKSGQTVNLLWKGDVAYLQVMDAEGNKATYSITFTRLYSDDNTLEGIYADGVLISGFTPEQRNYAYVLEPGTAYPVLSYKAKENAQVIFFGQLSQGKWGITVAAEDANTAASTYTVTYTFNKYSDITLKDLAVDGYSFAYNKTTTAYGPFLIDEGAALPAITAVPEEGQSVIKYNENDSTQKVLVMAENGNTNVYTIRYTRVKSNNVKLANIYVDGAPLFGFTPDNADYTVTLPRTATVVPNVNPVAQLPNQTVTTYFCQPGGVTRIHVEAQDGSSGDYTIAFPVEKSDNTLLKTLKINNEEKDVNVTEYTFDVPFGTIQPYDIHYTLEDGQLVHFVDAPLSGVTKIIVTNEKGNNNRTYTIAYNMAAPQGENKVANVKYSYVTASDETVNGEIVPAAGKNVIDLPYGAKSFTVTEVVKSYDEQSIQLLNGGIRRGAKIIAVANRDGENDVEYTITPNILPDTIGKLKDLKFNGVTVPNFRPDVYNYIVNVTTEPGASNFEAKDYDGNTVIGAFADDAAKKKQVTFNVPGGETYSVCWFYEEDKDPFDFRATWVNAGTTGYKPSNQWHVIADYTNGYNYTLANYNIPYVTGKEVSRNGENGLMLSTMRQGALCSSIPGMTSLSEWSKVYLKEGEYQWLTVTVIGVSETSISQTAADGILFRNTPEWLTFDYNALKSQAINAWSIKVYMGDGTTQELSTYSGNYNTKNVLFKGERLALNYPSGIVTNKINAILNSCATEQAKDMNGMHDVETADLVLQNMHLTYNSAFSAGTVDGVAMNLSETTFTKTVSDDYVGVPALKFTGAVHDQTQTIEWLNNGEWVNGELTAKVVNYGENALEELRDSTIYTVILKRTAVTTTDVDTLITGAHTTKISNDTVYINLPYGTKKMPELTIKPKSIHQLVTMTKHNNAVTVNVKAENGDEKTTIYVFREVKENDAALDDFSAVDKNNNSVAIETVDAATYTYKVVADEMPKIEYTKKMMGQTVDINYTNSAVTMLVTAADGVAQITYTINRVDPAVATTGLIEEFAKNGNPWPELGNTTYAVEEPKPAELITFTRKDAKDSVVYIQHPDSMEWQVYGSTNHTYVLRYPSAASSNAELANLLIGGVPYSDFIASSEETTITSDSMIVLDAVGAEAAQQIVTTQTAQDGEIVVYETEVTAANGINKKTYKTTVRRPKSNNALLTAVLLDSVAMVDFDPNTFAYDVVLPTPAVKKQQPQMPSITYVAGQAGQEIQLNPGQLNGEATEIIVKSEDGTVENTYYVTVKAQKSACVDLTGITVNGESIDQFEPGRHFYSKSLNTNTIELNYTADDRFLTVTPQVQTIFANHQYNYRLRVEAENGDTALYEVMLYIENQSNDAQLANILLNGKDFVDFERALNPDMHFLPTTAEYDINLPSGTTILPEVSATLKMDGQQVEIVHKVNPITQFTDSILLNVRAVDGTPNQYVLHFLVPQSRNTNLSMIFLNGDSINGFEPENYFYQHNLKVGVHDLPEVTGQKSEGMQLIAPVEMDQEKRQATIRVQAEDRTYSATYVVAFQFTQSDVDTLAMIYANGDSLAGFNPYIKYYEKKLPVGTTAFPELYWQDGDDYQSVHMDTVSRDSATLVRQIIVTSESMHTRTYTVSYTIEKSAVDSLNMIFVDQKQLPNFKPSVYEYVNVLSAAYANELNGQLPQIDYIKGYEDQNVVVSQMPEDETYLANNSLKQKTVITVTAANGMTKTYTIHYPVELSDDAKLNMIMLEGKPLANFDAERYKYKVEIESTSAIPVVSVIKKEDAQNYEIRVMNDTVRVDVVAESKRDSVTYTLAFERILSGNTRLNNIILNDSAEAFVSVNQFRFNPAWDSYTVDLNYEQGMDKESLLPSMEFDLADTLQTVRTVKSELEDGSIQIEIIVTAPNKDEGSYFITFKFAKSADNNLKAIYLNEVAIPDFSPMETDYIIEHPYGTLESEYFTADALSYILSDTLATAVDSISDNYTLYITVTAQNGKQKTYSISQTTGMDANADLLWIAVDGDTIQGFDPAQTFYVYDVYKGTATPSVTAQQASENASVPTVEDVSSIGDTCRIKVQAANGDIKVYEVYIRETLNKSQEASANDVLIKRVPGAAQMLVASIRSGVKFALYDINRQVLFTPTDVPEVNPNYADTYTDMQGKDVLNDVLNTGEGLLVDVEIGKPYIYLFLYNGQKVKSGIFIAQ